MIAPELYDRARERIAERGFTSVLQTKIAVLLSAAKTGNLAFHAAMQWAPALGLAQQFVISQASRELEAITLLARTTHWSAPLAVGTAWQVAAPLTAAWSRVMQPPGPLFNPAATYAGLSLGHAQFARIRLAPIVPEDADPLQPFAMALARIEQENGRMLQTQIRLLKVLAGDVPVAEREARIEADQVLVDGVMTGFLDWLAAPEAASLPPTVPSPWSPPWPASLPTPSP
ncbi:hypothetical protein H8N03_15630 [Ramlibacter sp. USB13]|uniref:Uncharacterized protein n=1 Tax=Ramlibacter cellulosilyticus TaxID=2764187 RepID=A0A923MUF5_9BURK|nr:hypothetical protein [Ramlibacter cellulosilyticus]MBC5784384.1 hypothetical protein [Ramlibacter cellulosilyticus]